ncbi:MAG: hypothetical protein QOE96_3539 [Blastocatellia bacterium]|jgi:hypothetical protein|nr:hypothetical protein [Blastocatellia bacterium]
MTDSERRAMSNKSLDARAESGFRNWLRAAQVALIRAGRSTQPLGGFPLYDRKH